MPTTRWTALTLIDAVDADISGFTADGAYDTIAVYEAAGARGAKVVVPTAEDSGRIAASATGERSRSHDHEDQADRSTPVETGVGLPPAGPRGERLLQVQVDHRRPASRSPLEGTGS